MPGIVVGVDGSEGSRHALAWAVAEAQLRRVPLTLLAAWDVPAGAYAGLDWPAVERDVADDLSQGTERRVDELCAEFSQQLEGLTVVRRVVEGAAAPALVEEARDADLLVVGTRGHGGLAGLVLGSVSRQCARHSPCPVVIIPPATNGRS